MSEFDQIAEGFVVGTLKLMAGAGESTYIKLDNGNEYTVQFYGNMTSLRPHTPKISHRDPQVLEAEYERVLEMAKKQRDV